MGPSRRSLKVLLVDASEARGSALRSALEREFTPLTLEGVDGPDGLAGALMRRGWDVVLYSGEGPDAVPPRKARALVRLSDPNLPFVSVSPSIRPNDLLALVKGFDGEVPQVSDPSRVADAIRAQLEAAGRRPGDAAHRLLHAQQAVADHMASGLMGCELLEAVMGSLAETLDWGYAELWRPVDGGLVCTAVWTDRDASEQVASLAARSQGSTLVPGRGMAGRVYAFRRPAWAADLRGEMASGVAFPIAQGEQCEGVLALYSPAVREHDRDQAALFAAVGLQLARYLNTHRERGETLRHLTSWAR